MARKRYPAEFRRRALDLVAAGKPGAVIASEGLPVEVACRVLGVSCAGFYARRFRPPSVRAVRHAWLSDVIREVHAAYGSYGAKRVHAELVLGRGIRVGHNVVAMLMRRAGIQGRTGSPKRRGHAGIATADDLVDRMFVREQPNQLGVIEAFWSRMQVELLDTRRRRTRVELANAIFEYIEIFHHRRRRHSSLCMRTPIEYELLNTTPAAA